MPAIATLESPPFPRTSPASAFAPPTLHGPRERAAFVGIQALADEDLVALVLGTGSGGDSARALATRLLEDFGGLVGMLRRGPGGLAEARGVGSVKALRLLAGAEIGRRALTTELAPSSAPFHDFEHVVAWARPRLAALEHEELWLLALDGRQSSRATRRIAVGGVHGLHVTARDVLRAVLREGASAFLVVHNHPSGDPAPSAADIDFTARLCRAAHAVGAPLLDHVIVARDGATSLLASGLLPEA